MTEIKTFQVGIMPTNSYVIRDIETSAMAIVDPGEYSKEAVGYIKSNGGNLEMILLTHGHFDHIFGVAALQRKYSVPVLMGEADADLLAIAGQSAEAAGLKMPDTGFRTTPLTDGQALTVLKGSPFTAIATPGHTEGGFCFYDETDKVLFSGDTLFAGTIGRTDLFGGEYDKLIVSVMDRLMGLPGDVDVLPGHGTWTTVGNERTGNPFLQPFNEPEEDAEADSETLAPTE